jgi:hypothetical protein
MLPLDEIENFKNAKCLVVTNLSAYTEEQKLKLSKAQLPILVIGEDTKLPLECSAKYKGDYISVAIYNANGIDLNLESLCALDKIIEPEASVYGDIWTAPLSYKRVDEQFFTELCRMLNVSFSADLSMRYLFSQAYLWCFATTYFSARSKTPPRISEESKQISKKHVTAKRVHSRDLFHSRSKICRLISEPHTNGTPYFTRALSTLSSP